MTKFQYLRCILASWILPSNAHCMGDFGGWCVSQFVKATGATHMTWAGGSGPSVEVRSLGDATPVKNILREAMEYIPTQPPEITLKCEICTMEFEVTPAGPFCCPSCESRDVRRMAV